MFCPYNRHILHIFQGSIAINLAFSYNQLGHQSLHHGTTVPGVVPTYRLQEGPIDAAVAVAPRQALPQGFLKPGSESSIIGST
jgi:hypothetical protein